MILVASRATMAFTLPYGVMPHSSLGTKFDLATRPRHNNLHNMISSGFSFDDGEQLLVSLQKPFGVVLEQNGEGGDSSIRVASVDPSAGSAGNAGVQVGDVLVAVQNRSTLEVDLEDVLEFLANGPRVMNLRFVRPQA